MKKTIPFARFDAELDTDVCDAYNNADLTLTLRLGFTQINPPGTAATGTYNDYGSATGLPRQIVRWTPAAWAAWKTDFVTTAQQFWTGKFWLVNDSGLFSYAVGSTTFVPNIYCKLRIVASDGAAGTHHAISVVRLASTETWFGSNEVLYDSLDTRRTRKGTDSHGRPIMQRAHVHEVGHLMGLDHVDVGQPHCPASGDTNIGACYGVDDASQTSVMGRGMQLRLENAAPWRNAIRGFAMLEVMQGGAAATGSLFAPYSRLFAFPTHLLASWPARMRRHFPRTLDEATRGVDITSRVARAA